MHMNIENDWAEMHDNSNVSLTALYPEQPW